MESAWQAFKATEQKVARVQTFLGKSDRFKDTDLREVTRHFVRGKIHLGLYYLARIVSKETLYEVYRHTVGHNRRLVRPIFVLGLPHSGTTISMSLLSLHPLVSNASELNTYWHPEHYADPKNTNHVRTSEPYDLKEAKRIQSRMEFERWRHGNRPYFLNKNPDNTLNSRYLKRYFPDCHIVHVVRDSIPVVNSLIHNLPDRVETYDRFKKPEDRVNPWAGVRPVEWKKYLDPNPVIQHAHQWNFCVQSVREDETLYPIEVSRLRYEDLCADPKKEISRIWAANSLPVSDEVVDLLPKSLVSSNRKESKLSPSDITRIEEITFENRRFLKYTSSHQEPDVVLSSV